MDYKALIEKKKQELKMALRGVPVYPEGDTPSVKGGKIIQNPTPKKMMDQGMGAQRKKCCRCKMLCLLSEFGKHYGESKNSICKVCKSQQNKNFYEKMKKNKSRN